jgi:acyl carrier protein
MELVDLVTDSYGINLTLEPADGEKTIKKAIDEFAQKLYELDD